MDLSTQICCSLKQLLKEYNATQELETVNLLETFFAQTDSFSENYELMSLLLQVSNKSDIMKLYCHQYNFMSGEKTGLKTLGSVIKWVANPLESKGIQQTMSGLLKVSNHKFKGKQNYMIFFLFFSIFSLVNGIKLDLPSTEVEITKDHIILNSEIRMTELYEITEKIDLEPLFQFLSQINATLLHIEQFTEFQESHTACAVYGNPNDNTDSIEDIKKIAKDKGLNNLLISHQEKTRNHNFMTLFRMINGSFSCEISYSLARIQLLLASNTRRIPPYYVHERISYRNSLYDLFRDKNGLKCLRHGLIKNKNIFPYNFKQYVEEPGIEACSQICKTMHLKFKQGLSINKLTGIQLNLEDCAIWSFAISNKTCFIKHNISQNMFLNKMSFESDYEFMSVTGKPDCQMKLDSGYPSMFINNQLTDLREICSFSENNLIFTKYNARCMNLYFSIKQPLKKLQLDVIFFIKSFLIKNRLNSKPVKRSIGNFFGPVSTFLGQAVAREGISLLDNVFYKPSLQPLEMLTNIINNIRQAGYRGKVVKKVKRKRDNININQFLQGFKILQQVSNKIVNKNFNIILEGLAQNGTKIMSFFESLIQSDDPIFNSTINFIQNSSYLFSSYVIPTDEVIIRHFLKPVIKNKYKSNMISYIPLNEGFFDNKYWQSDTFVGSEQETPNSCLIQLLAGLNGKLPVNCQYSKSSKLMKNDNIFFVKHHYGDFAGRVVLINQPGLVEVSCKEGSLMEKTKGLIVFAISEDCKILFNGIQIFNSKINTLGFPPRLILRYNETIQQLIEHHFEYIDEVQFIIMGIIFIFFSFCIGCKKCKKVQIPLTEKNRQVKEFELVQQEEMIASVD